MIEAEFEALQASFIAEGEKREFSPSKRCLQGPCNTCIRVRLPQKERSGPDVQFTEGICD